MKAEELSVFPVGGKNEAFAKYFVGQSYLNIFEYLDVFAILVKYKVGGIFEI